MYSHNAWYNKSDGELTPYLDPNTVIITPKNIGEMLYGAINNNTPSRFERVCNVCTKREYLRYQLIIMIILNN